jgi:hypothetical protein
MGSNNSKDTHLGRLLQAHMRHGRSDHLQPLEAVFRVHGIVTRHSGGSADQVVEPLRRQLLGGQPLLLDGMHAQQRVWRVDRPDR